MYSSIEIRLVEVNCIR